MSEITTLTASDSLQIRRIETCSKHNRSFPIFQIGGLGGTEFGVCPDCESASALERRAREMIAGREGEIRIALHAESGRPETEAAIQKAAREKLESWVAAWTEEFSAQAEAESREEWYDSRYAEIEGEMLEEKIRELKLKGN
jgi:hypothetical protein